MNIKIGNEDVEQLNKFKYLDGITNSKGEMKDEINVRIASTGSLFNAIKTMFPEKRSTKGFGG